MNLYFHLRLTRPCQIALRRKLYRYIADEKKRLTESGVDVELVRLECRYLSNLSNRAAHDRYMFYKAQGRLFDGV